jgi:DNA-binding MarR family transcriptional regulator
MTTAAPAASRTGLPTAELLDLEAQMAVIGRRMRRVMAERAAAVHPELGAISYGVLEHLNRSGECRQTEMITALGSEKGAISRAVQQLVDLGLVARVPDPDDGRAHQIAISAEGTRRLQDVVAARRSVYAERLADWTPDQMNAFVKALARYNAALEQPFVTTSDGSAS